MPPSKGQDPVVWKGTLEYGDGERTVEARVRRMDEHALLAEVLLDGHWGSPDDDLAARAYEQALLKELGRRGLPPSKEG